MNREATHEYSDLFETEDGERYRATAVGRARSNATFEGWIDFVSSDGTRLATDIETTQPNEAAFRYWASGVSPTYLEGAFHRAKLRLTGESTRPAGQRPAVLDPFEIDAQGEGMLAAQLIALDLDRLHDIAAGYELVPPETAAWASREELIVEILGLTRAGRQQGRH